MNELLIQLLRASQHTITGRLSRDPQIRTFENGNAVANVSMAVNQPGSKRDDGQEPDWFKVAVWGEQAMAFADACHKGDLVKVSGRCKTETWTTDAGEKRTQWVITADEWELVRANGINGGPAAAAKPAAAAPAPANADWFGGGAASDEELPF